MPADESFESLAVAMAEARAARIDSAAALALAHKAHDKAVKLERDLFGGDPDRPGEKGILKEVLAEVRANSRQNWAILLAILALIGAMVAVVLGFKS